VTFVLYIVLIKVSRKYLQYFCLNNSQNIFIGRLRYFMFTCSRDRCLLVLLSFVSSHMSVCPSSLLSIHRIRLYIHSFILPSINLSIYHSSIHPIIHLSIYSSIHQLISLFISSSIQLSIHPPIKPPLYSSFYPSIHPFIHSFIHPFSYLLFLPPTHFSIHQFIYPAIYSSTH
jgi:hypothetical protein